MPLVFDSLSLKERDILHVPLTKFSGDLSKNFRRHDSLVSSGITSGEIDFRAT